MTSRLKRKSTAGPIARCAIIRASTISTGKPNFLNRLTSSSPRVWRKSLNGGLTEKNVFIGDIYRWGDALIQVTQPRSPCFKLNYHFGIQDMSAQLQNAGKTGWLYRVVQAGQVSADAPLELASRLSEVSVYEACAIAAYAV